MLANFGRSWGGVGNRRDRSFAVISPNAVLFVLIEDEGGIRNIEEILSVEGIDAVFLGPFDMSVGMGLQGNTTTAPIAPPSRACWTMRSRCGRAVTLGRAFCAAIELIQSESASDSPASGHEGIGDFAGCRRRR